MSIKEPFFPQPQEYVFMCQEEICDGGTDFRGLSNGNIRCSQCTAEYKWSDTTNKWTLSTGSTYDDRDDISPEEGIPEQKI